MLGELKKSIYIHTTGSMQMMIRNGHYYIFYKTLLMIMKLSNWLYTLERLTSNNWPCQLWCNNEPIIRVHFYVTMITKQLIGIDGIGGQKLC